MNDLRTDIDYLFTQIKNLKTKTKNLETNDDDESEDLDSIIRIMKRMEAQIQTLTGRVDESLLKLDRTVDNVTEIKNQLDEVTSVNSNLVDDLFRITDTGRIGIKEPELWKRLVDEYVSLTSNMGRYQFGRLDRTIREQKISRENKATDGKVNLPFQDYVTLTFSMTSVDATVLLNGNNIDGNGDKTNRMTFGMKIKEMEPILFVVEVDDKGIWVRPDAHDFRGRMFIGDGKEKIQYYTFQVCIFREMSRDDSETPVMSLDLTAWTYDFDNTNKNSVIKPRTPRQNRYSFPVEARWINSTIKIVTYDIMATDLVYYSVICPNIDVAYTEENVINVIKSDQIYYPIYDSLAIQHIKLTMLRYGIIYLSEISMDGKTKKVVHKFEQIDTSMNYIKQYQLAFTAYVNDIISRTAVYGECRINGINQEKKVDDYLTISSNFAEEVKRSETLDLSVCDTTAFHLSYPDPPKLDIKSTAITSENRTSISMDISDKWKTLLYNNVPYTNKFIYEILYSNENGQVYSATMIGGVQMSYERQDNTKIGFEWDVSKVFLKSYYKYRNKVNYRYGWIDIMTGRHDDILHGRIQCGKPEAYIWIYIFDPGWILPLSSSNEVTVEIQFDEKLYNVNAFSPRQWTFDDGLKTYGLYGQVKIQDSDFFYTNTNMTMELSFKGFATELPESIQMGYFGFYNKRVTKKCQTKGGYFIYDINVIDDLTNARIRMDCDTRCLLQMEVMDHTWDVVRFLPEDGSAVEVDTVTLSRGQSWIVRNKPIIKISGKFTSPSKPVQLSGLTEWNEITEANVYMIRNLVVYTQFINRKVDAVEIRVKTLMQMLDKMNGPMQKWASLLNIAAIVAFPINPMVGTLFMFTGSLLELAHDGLNVTSILNVMGNALAFHFMLMHTLRMSKFMNERYKVKLNINNEHETTFKETLDVNDDTDEIVIFDRSKMNITETIQKRLWDVADEELDTTDYKRKLILDPANSLENETRTWYNLKTSMDKVRTWISEKTGKWNGKSSENVNTIAYEMKEFDMSPFGVVERIAVPLEDARIRPLGAAYEAVRVAETTFGDAKEGFGIQRLLQEHNVTPEHSYLRATWIDTEKQPITRKFQGKVTKYTILLGVADFQKAESIASRGATGSSNIANEAGKFIIAERKTFSEGGLWANEYDFERSHMTANEVDGIWNQQIINMDALKADSEALSKTTVERKYEILCRMFDERYNNRKGMRVINKPAPIGNIIAREFILRKIDKIGLNYNLLFNNCQHFTQAMMEFMTHGYIPEYIKSDDILLQEYQKFIYEYDTSLEDLIKFDETQV